MTAALLALILIVLFFGLLREQRAQVLKLLLWPGIILTVMGGVVAELIWFRRDYENALAANLVILATAGGTAAFYGPRWFFRHYWWSWPPRNWKLALLLSKIHRECAPPLQFLTAKTVYIEDITLSDMEGTAFLEVKKWGRFEVVSDRAKADLILSLSMIRPGAQFGTWVQARPELAQAIWKKGFERLDEAEKVKIPYGCANLEVTDLKQNDIWGSRFVTLWQSHPRSATRDLIRQLRKTVTEAEKWYGRK